MATGAVIARIITQYSNKGSKAAQRDITKLGKQFDDFSKKVFKAFAVAGAAAAAFAIKIGKDAVEGAMEDQKAQAALANTLRNTVGATDAVIASTVIYLDQLELAVGVNNNELIPSLQRLVTATGDVTQAQQLQALALDVSAGTGRSLAQVTEAFARALGGSLTALRRIAPTLDENIIKNKDLSAAFRKLSEIYGGQAATRAETFEFRMLRLSLAFDQILDSLGHALIPVLENFVDFIRVEILPVLDSWVSANKDDIAASLESVIQNSIKAGKAIARFVGFISDNLQTLKNFAAIMIGVFVAGKVYAGIVAITGAISALRIAFAAQTVAATSAAVATSAATGGANLLAAAAALTAFAAATGFTLAALNNTKDATAAIGEEIVKYNPHLQDLNKAYKTGSKETKTTLNNLTNFFGASKKLTAEEQKRIQIQKAINKAKLDEFGIKNVSTTDPISLEAGRLNLIKEGNIAEQKRFEAMLQFNEEQRRANELATRYADILSVIADRQVTPAEVAALAAKWGETEEAVIRYLAHVTKAPLPQGWNDPGNTAADGWKAATNALNSYYEALGAAPIPVVSAPPSITSPTTPTTPTIPTLPSLPTTPALAEVLKPLIPVPGMGGVSRGEYNDIIPLLPQAPVITVPKAEVPPMETYIDDFMRRNMTTGKIEITVNESGFISEETKKAIVDTIVEASSSGYSTNWYRTTGGLAIA